VSRALAARGWTIQSQALVYISKNPVSLAPEARTEVEAFLEALDSDDDVQTIYVGLAD
jgi:transcriptional/translational regulatory protein YebC/TACO1